MTSSPGNLGPLDAHDGNGGLPRSGERGAPPPLKLVHPELGHGQVTLMEPSSRGYLYLAASVRPGPIPFANLDANHAAAMPIYCRIA
jgi:hypothetical protein